MSASTLQLADLLQLAAFVSAHCEQVVESHAALPLAALHTYWRCGRDRNHFWVRQLQSRLETSGHTAPDAVDSSWAHCRRVAVEVFVTEPLTRVWTALLTASDRRRGERLAEPIGRSVFVGHLEARRLCLQAMVNASDAVLDEVVELDRLRRRVERWTDVLISPLAAALPVEEFAFSPERAREFAAETSSSRSRAAVRRLVAAGMHLGFSDAGLQVPVSSENHTGVVVSVLSCFPADAVEETGELKSLRLLRLYRSFHLSDQMPPPQSQSARLARAAQRLSELLERGRVPSVDPRNQQPGISFRRLRDRFREC